MELAQRDVECVSGANFSKKKNTIPQLAENKCASHVSDVVMIVTPRMSVSSKRTLVLIVKKVGHIVKNCFAKKTKKQSDSGRV